MLAVLRTGSFSILPRTCGAVIGQHREELFDISLCRLLAVFADFEGFGVLDLVAYVCAVPFHERGSDGGRDLTFLALLGEPGSSRLWVFRYTVELAVDPRQPFVELRYVRVEGVELEIVYVIDRDCDVGTKRIRTLEVVLEIQEHRVLAQRRCVRHDVR